MIVRKLVFVLGTFIGLNFIACSKDDGGSGYVPPPPAAGYVSDDNPIQYGTGKVFLGALGVKDKKQFEAFLQHRGLCNPAWVGYNFGTSDCGYWIDNGSFILLQNITGNSAILNVGAGTSNPLYSYGTYLYVPLTSSVQSYNYDKGMLIVGTPDIGLRAYVDNGRPDSDAFDVRLVYQGVEFATAYVQIQ